MSLFWVLECMTKTSGSITQSPRFNTYNAEQRGLLPTMATFNRFHPLSSFFKETSKKRPVVPPSCQEVKPCHSEDFHADRMEGWAFPGLVAAPMKTVSAAIDRIKFENM